MSQEKIVSEIARLRAKLHNLIDTDASHNELLTISQKLNKYITMYLQLHGYRIGSFY